MGSLIFGILFIIIGVIGYVFRNKIREILPMYRGAMAFVPGILGFIIIFQSMILYAEQGYMYFVLSPTGQKSAITSEGMHIISPASIITKWQKFIDIKTITSDQKESGDVKLDEIEGIMEPIPIRFIDQVTAKVLLSTRFKLPQDEDSFISLAVGFRSMENLVQNTLIPTVKEQVVNTGYMFSAQNYISGESQQFRTTIDEHLKDGTYIVEKKELRDTVYIEKGIQNLDGERKIKDIETKYIVEKVLENGVPKRIPHEINSNNIKAVQVIVDHVDLESTFKKRLEAQRDESAKRQLEQQKIETAKAAQARIVAEGERDKARERATQEKEQVKILIAEETKLKQEETKRKLAKIALETEKLTSKKKKVAADAKRYELQNADGLSESEKYKIDAEVRKAEKVAQNIKDLRLPQVLINGGGKGGDGSSIKDILEAAMVKQLIEKK